LVGDGSRLQVSVLRDGRSSSRHRRAATPAQLVLASGVLIVGVRDQPSCDRGSRTNGGGDAEMDWLTVDQHEGRVITGHHSHKQEDDA
jgi:hypothetical protein